MRLSTIRIPCRDLAKSEVFYRDKLGLDKLFGSPADGYVGLALDNAQLLLEPEEPGEFECGGYLGFSIAVDDIDAFYTSCIERGIEFTGPPEKQRWGGIMTHVKDGDGNVFSVVG